MNNKITRIILLWGGLVVALLVAGNVVWQTSGRDENESDTIRNEIYGSYPSTIPFQQGMTLMPGQSSELSLTFDADDWFEFNAEPASTDEVIWFDEDYSFIYLMIGDTTIVYAPVDTTYE